MQEDRVEQSLEQFESLCRRQGLPLTVQRREILKAVLQRDDHPTAETVYESVKDRIAGLSRTTVYRVLETLVELGVVRRLHYPGTNARFDAKTTRHHHLVCRMCYRAIDVENQQLDQIKLPSAKEHGFLIEDYSVHIVGLCADCRKKKPQDGV